MTEDRIRAILERYNEEIFPKKRKELVKKFLMAKIEIMSNLYQRGGA